MSASEAVFVGDAIFHDIAGARHVGMKTVLLKRLGEKEIVGTGSPNEIVNGLKEFIMTMRGLLDEE